MFQKILLPVDLSDKHGPALNAAAQLASQSGGEVILLHVIEIIPGLEVEDEKHFYSRLEKLAASHLDKLGKVLQAKRIRWRAKTLLGNRGAETLRQAQENGVDLIIVTSPRVDPQHVATGWGSLSYKIGLAATCPVLLVK
jgi:nucleotide-binding universal stress UspA family protein